MRVAEEMGGWHITPGGDRASLNGGEMQNRPAAGCYGAVDV